MSDDMDEDVDRRNADLDGEREAEIRAEGFKAGLAAALKALEEKLDDESLQVGNEVYCCGVQGSLDAVKALLEEKP